VKMGNKGSKWYSRSMGLLGTLILMFLVLHLYDFWIPSRFTGIDHPEMEVRPGKHVHNLFALMQVTFTKLWLVIIYVLACISLCWHLIHGFQSAFRSIGVSNSRYLTIINNIGIAFSVIITIAFIMMPVSMYLGWVK
jgi:succinate dehydrogenase / fumarate reductase, cytochrome b subunit